MNDEIYAHIGINEEDLNTTYTAILRQNGITYIHDYKAKYNYDLIVNMPFIGKGDNADIDFLKQLVEEKSKYISKYNESYIKNGNISKLINEPQAWYRDAKYYFQKLLEKHPLAFSTNSENGNKNNKWRIENNFNPIVDQKFIEYFGVYVVL